MALEIKVHSEVKGFEAKVIGSFSWRQLLCIMLGIPLIAGATFLMWNHQDYLTLVDMLVFLPFAVWGWWRPKGLKPEKFIKSTAPEFFGPKEFHRAPVAHPQDEDAHPRHPRRPDKAAEHRRKVLALEAGHVLED